MNETLRRIAVSGSAAVALLGGAAAITAASAPEASAASIETAVNRAAGAPVTLPDGRTIHVRGLDTAGYRADDHHYTAAVTLASAKTSGTGAPLQNPYNQQQVPAGYSQQIQTQSSGVAIGIGTVSILVLGIIVFIKVKHSGLKPFDATLGVLFGIALSGTVIGGMGSDLTNSVVGSLGTMLGGLG